MTPDLSTFLMFSGKRHGQALDAINFYVQLFPNSSVTFIDKYGPGESGPEGTVKLAKFVLSGRPFMAIDSPVAHGFDFTPSISIFVECESATEVEHLFKALAESGQQLMPLGRYDFSQLFGWVNDRFGVSWQLSLPLASKQ